MHNAQEAGSSSAVVIVSFFIMPLLWPLVVRAVAGEVIHWIQHMVPELLIRLLFNMNRLCLQSVAAIRSNYHIIVNW